jgi:hypothetical protein
VIKPLTPPGTVVGYRRRDGRPIYAIAGGAEADPPGNSGEGNQGGSDQGGGSTDPARTFSQDEVNRMLTREKDQGSRAGVRALLDKLGVDKADDLEGVLTRQREAEQAQLSEAERAKRDADNARATADRERDAAKRDRASVRIERALLRANVNVNLLDDASILVGNGLGDDADEQAVTDAVASLAERMPTMFGEASGTPTQSQPRPPASPTSQPPARPQPAPQPWGAGGLAEARRRGLLRDEAKTG